MAAASEHQLVDLHGPNIPQVCRVLGDLAVDGTWQGLSLFGIPHKEHAQAYPVMPWPEKKVAR